MEADGVLAAVLVVGGVVVGHRPLPLSVVDVDVLVGGDPVELKVLPVDLVTAVGRGVVGDDCEVVGVVLREDRVEVVLDPEPGVVEVARGQDADRQLFGVGVEVQPFVQFAVGEGQHPPFLLVVAAVDFVVEHGQRQVLDVFVLFDELFSFSVEADPRFSQFLSGVQHFFDPS